MEKGASLRNDTLRSGAGTSDRSAAGPEHGDSRSLVATTPERRSREPRPCRKLRRSHRPAAAQVADRWHLLNNLFETLTRSLERHRPLMREVRDLLEPQAEPDVPHLTAGQPATEAQKRKEQKRARRLERYEAIKRLVDAGMSHSEASRRIGVPFRTVQRWLACGVFPERKERRFPNSVDAFGEHLEKRYRDGCRNATQLWREIKQLGFSGKGCSVWRWLRRRFGANGEVSVSPRASRAFPISPQHVAWLILRANVSKHRYLQALYNASPQIAAMARTARQFFQMIRACDAAVLPRWLQEAQDSPLASFARRLRRDQNSVDAALRMPWSNGMVEGQIHRLKLLQATNVWTRQLRPAQAPRPQPGLKLQAENTNPNSHNRFTKCEPEPKEFEKQHMPWTRWLSS